MDATGSSEGPTELVAAALDGPGWPQLLRRAGELATSCRDRQLVAIATALLGGDPDRAQLLARDHLAEYPDSALVARIAGTSIRLDPHPDQEETQP